MAVFIQSYEQAIRENGTGYPEDFYEKGRWDYADYLYWIVEQWVPMRVREKVRKLKKQKKETSSNKEGEEGYVVSDESVLMSGETLKK